MDDKYAKEYKKQKSQFHEHLEKKWEPRPKDYKEDWHKEQLKKIQKPKPDPATVEAELQLEEQLWAS